MRFQLRVVLEHLKKQLLEKDDYETQIAGLHCQVDDLATALAAKREVNTVRCPNHLF